jgi:hypothetical protein
MFLGPRAGIFFWWLFDQARWDSAFNSFILPFIGFLFLPWTTLMYVLMFRNGINGFEWVLLGFGLLSDIGMYSGGGYGNRGRLNRGADR